MAKLHALLLVSVLLQGQAPAPSISKYDRGASITMLKQVKADLKEHYYDTTFRGMDLDKTFAEAEENLRSAGSVNQAIAGIVDVLMRLNDSHTMFYPPDRKSRPVYGWEAAMIGDVPYVIDVTKGSDAEKKGLAPGDRLVFWNRYEPGRQNLWQLRYLYNFVRPQAMQRLVVRKPDGAEKVVDVESKIEQQRAFDLEELLEQVFASLAKTDDRETTVGDTYVWRYSAFGDPKTAERAIKRARAAKSLILDLRGNSGGSIDALRNVVTWLFDRDILVATEKTRKGDKPMPAKGRKDAFPGPLTVLIDSRSGSAAEMLARVVQIEKRGTVIGDRSAGAVMTARMFPHTIGIDKIAFYATTITIGDVRMSDGSSLEHVGVTPDETLLPTAADLAARRDPVLARAIGLLGGTMTAEQAGQLFK
jgi:C-terminal processing protease CtpA/Prc